MDYQANKDKFVMASGRRLTTGLFAELEREETATSSVTSLAEWRKKYVEIADPTGYEACMELLGDWEHWLLLRKNPVLKQHFDAWDKEVEVKLRSQAIKNLISISKSEKGQASAKWLAEAGFKIEQDKRKKDVKEKEAAVSKEVSEKVAADMARLGISVVSGGK